MPVRTLAELAEHCGALLEGDGDRRVTGPADLEDATGDEISFLANPRYAPLLESTAAAGVVVGHGVTRPRESLTLLRVEDPNRAFTTIVSLFAEEEQPAAPGIDPNAAVHPSAQIGEGASIGPCCTVGPGARIETGAVLRAGVHVGEGCRVGARTVLHPGVVLNPRVEVGAECLVHAGTVLGSDGFGFEPSASGWNKIPQCGTVIVGDRVEIGANCTVDRARFGATTIGDGVKIDNLVHIAHNVRVGADSLLIAQVGISGSARIGSRVILAGQAGVNGHVRIGDGARVGGQSGVTSDIPPGLDYSGYPARPRMQALRELAYPKRIPRLEARLEELERRLEAIEEVDPR